MDWIERYEKRRTEVDSLRTTPRASDAYFPCVLPEYRVGIFRLLRDEKDLLAAIVPGPRCGCEARQAAKTEIDKCPLLEVCSDLAPALALALNAYVSAFAAPQGSRGFVWLPYFQRGRARIIKNKVRSK